MHTGEATYSLVYRGEGFIKRNKGKSMPFRYRVWLGKSLEPVCLVTLNDASHSGPITRRGIRRAILEMLSKEHSVRYFECVIRSQRIVTEVYFPKLGQGIGFPRGEARSLQYLECILEQRVAVV